MLDPPPPMHSSVGNLSCYWMSNERVEEYHSSDCSCFFVVVFYQLLVYVTLRHCDKFHYVISYITIMSVCKELSI